MLGREKDFVYFYLEAQSGRGGKSKVEKKKEKKCKTKKTERASTDDAY